MTIRITPEEPNIFPIVEDVDARDSGREAAIFLGTRIDGQFMTVVINLTYEQASDLAVLLKPFAIQEDTDRRVVKLDEFITRRGYPS